MKKTLISVLTFGSIAFLLPACQEEQQSEGSASNVTARLDSLEAERTRIDAEIQSLRSQLSAGSQPERMQAVTVAPVAESTFRHYIDVIGAVRSDQNALVSAKSSGIIRKVFVTEGQNVAAGAVLAELDDSILQRSIDQLKSNLSYAVTMYEKYKKVWEQNVGSEAQYLQAKNAKESLEKQLEVLQQQLADTKIRAPFSGVIDAVIPKIGEAISPGMPFCRIVNLANLRVEATIAESYIGKIRKGDMVKVTFKDVQQEFNAPIRSISQSIDAKSRSFTIFVDIPASARSVIRPNMLATLTINDETVEKALTIPVNTVQRFENDAFVYVAEQQGDKTIARKKVVTTGTSYNGAIHVLQGLAQGDMLITLGFQELSDGDVLLIK